MVRCDAGASKKVYAVNSSTGAIYSADPAGTTWTKVREPATATKGNGLITDGKERLLYPQTRYLGMFDGSTWDDDWKDFGDSSLANAADYRPADMFEDWVVFGNGYKVAILNIYDDSFNSAGLTFPTSAKVVCVRSNRSGVLLGVNFDKRGALVLWDVSSDRSSAPWIWFNSPVQSITKYGDQWIVYSGGKLYVTNGYIITEELPMFPDDDLINYNGDWSSIPYKLSPDGMTVINGTLILGISDTNQLGTYNGRRKAGLYYLNLSTKTWEFTPPDNRCTYGLEFGGTLIDESGTFYYSYSSTKPSYAGIGKITTEFNGLSTSNIYATYISPVIGSDSEIDKVMEAIKITTNPETLPTSLSLTPSPNHTITVSVFNFKRRLWSYVNTSAQIADLDKVKVNGSSRITLDGVISIGDQVLIRNGVNAGEIRYITAITGSGTNNEQWQLDTAFSSAVESGITLEITPFQKVDTQTINTWINKDYFFNVDKSPIGRKFLIKIDIKATNGNLVPEITGISVLWNNLSF